MSTRIQYLFQKLKNEVKHKIDEFDRIATVTSIQRFIDDNWTDEDILAYCRCTEEINPHMDEDVALSMMSKISSKYKK